MSDDPLITCACLSLLIVYSAVMLVMEHERDEIWFYTGIVLVEMAAFSFFYSAFCIFISLPDPSNQIHALCNGSGNNKAL